MHAEFHPSDTLLQVQEADLFLFLGRSHACCFSRQGDSQKTICNLGEKTGRSRPLEIFHSCPGFSGERLCVRKYGFTYIQL